MATATRRQPATFSPDFTKNYNEMPEEVWRPFVEQFVALSLDGKEILASGASYPDLYADLRAKAIDRSQVVIDYVDDPAVLACGPTP